LPALTGALNLELKIHSCSGGLRERTFTLTFRLKSSCMLRGKADMIGANEARIREGSDE
jgi:hypothetical protein